MDDPDWQEQRRWLLATLEREGIRDRAVLAAIGRVPRHLFVPPAERARAYENRPLPIGLEQTISQPFIVAYMIEAARLTRSARVLEIGTGSGYHAAVLADVLGLGPGDDDPGVPRGQLVTVEILPELAARAACTLAATGYGAVVVREGDGRHAAADRAPFDAILVAAAPDQVPWELVDLLAEGGRLVVPVGREGQWLKAITRVGATRRAEDLIPVRFVPLTAR